MQSIIKFNRNALNQRLNSSNYPVMDGLLLLFVSVLGNYVGQTINPSLQKLIEGSREVQYIVLFVLLFATISLSFSQSNMRQTIVSSLGIFIMFYVISMFSVNTNISILAALLVRYSADKYVRYLENNDQNKKFKRLIHMTNFVKYAINNILIVVIGVGGVYKISDETGLLQKLCAMI